MSKSKRPITMEELSNNKETATKRKAYDKAVRQAVAFSLEGYKSRLGKSIDKKEYLESIINSLEERLNKKDFSKELMLSGRRNYSGFTDQKCDKILSNEKPKPWKIEWREKKNEGEFIIRENSTFELTVIYKLKNKLEKVLQKIKSDTGINEDKQTKPADKWNWIEKQYQENRENFSTDDEWAEATSKRFKEKFKTSEGGPDSMKRYGKYKGRH